MKLRLILILGLSFFFYESQAQTFNGFQTTGTNSLFFCISYNGTANIGLGYSRRVWGSAFGDIHTELRFPVQSMYKFEQFEFITGWYGPVKVKRTFLGFGSHLRIKHIKDQATTYGLAITGIPSYVYKSSLNDGPYGTAGIRLTYQPQIVMASGSSNKSFVHHFEGGIHADLSLKRTLGLSLNSTIVELEPGKEKLNPLYLTNSNFYWGQWYRLRRTN
ncbi:hypothetical protein GYB22_10115 [bacterium]|nr:hypothetical protein [bacterium]